jgi:hypothetical protein
MQEVNFEEGLERILASDTRYRRGAYVFLREALDHTHKMLGKADSDVIHHVTGGQLLEGIRQYAAQQFGPDGHDRAQRVGHPEVRRLGGDSVYDGGAQSAENIRAGQP